MTTASVDAVLRVGVQVAYGVTDLSTTFPHGGTSLGTIGGPPVVRIVRHTDAEVGGDDKYAGQMTGMRFAGESWLMGVLLRQWDPDLMAAMLYNWKTTGGVKVPTDFTQATTPYAPGSSVPSLGNMVFSPVNPQHPAMLFYDVRPVFEETQELHFSFINEFTLPLIFQAFTTSKGMYQGPALLSKLELT